MLKRETARKSPIEYEKMQEHLDMLEEIYKAEVQIDSGEGIAHKDAQAQVLGKLVKQG